MEKGFSKLIHS